MTFLKQDDRLKEEDRAKMARHISASIPTFCQKEDTSASNGANTCARGQTDSTDSVMSLLGHTCDLNNSGKSVEDITPTMVCGSHILQVTPGQFCAGQYAMLIATPATIGGLPNFITAPVAAVGADQNNNSFCRPNSCTAKDQCVQITKLDNGDTTVNHDVYNKGSVNDDQPTQSSFCPIHPSNDYSLWRPWAFGQ